MMLMLIMLFMYLMYLRRPKDYHSMDVHLFWGLLRSNAEQQLAAWQQQQQ